MTSFVGRRRELSEAKLRMTESRLLTLTGPGGVGKTRLAFELADRSRKAFRDGVCAIELASLEDGSSVASTVLSVLSVPDQSNRPALEKLVEYLRDRQLLIVLDNCEHLLPAIAALAAVLLRAAPGLRILATSREPMGIAGERMCLIPPLTTPSPLESHPAAGLEQFEAVNLLIDRARSIVPDFAVTDENSDAVVQLCNQLDGMPLAIELAATRLRALSMTQIVERLDRRFQLLTGGDRTGLPRQQTLRALIDWSCELCTPAEQLLWARLSVFPGSFDLESAENVCGFGDLDPLQIVDLIDRLVAKSIIFTERSGEQVRYGQLMTVREYGAELLSRGDGYAVLKRRQRNHYLQRAGDMVARWCGPGQAQALSAMRYDHANLLSALEWSVNTSGELRPAAELASLLRYHWIAGGFLSDGRRWLDRILEQPDEPNPERGAALWVGAWVGLIQGDREAAAGYLNECHATAAALGDPALEAHASHWCALHHLFCGNLSEAVDLYESAIATHKEAGDTASALTALFQLAMAQTYSGDLNTALNTCRESLELSSRHGERWTHAYSLWISALCRWQLGEMAQARKSAIEALEIQQDFKDSICAALTIELLSWIAASESQFDSAAELADAATAVWTGLGTTVDAFGPHLRADSVRSAEAVRNHLGAHRMAEISAQQPSMTKDAAIAKALGVTAPARKQAAVKSPLTMREREIAALVAEGLSNRAIAQSLVISPRTVDGHVEHILTKLGFVSRAQIASWAALQTVPTPSGVVQQ
jgi:predicted ATPase/DNA-binding CsgD family transcriptional regulator